MTLDEQHLIAKIQSCSGNDGANLVPFEIRDADLIVNPQAGGGRKIHQLDEARRIFRKAGIETDSEHDRSRRSDRHRATGCRESRQLVIVCGGDGTVNEAVNGLACSQVPLAVLPAGTANVLAKELSLPWSLPRAAERMCGRGISPHRSVATPEKSSGEPRYFLSVAGAGPDGTLVAAVRPEIKLPRAGIMAYWQEGFRQLTLLRFSALPASPRATGRHRRHARHRGPNETLRGAVEDHHRS